MFARLKLNDEVWSILSDVGKFEQRKLFIDILKRVSRIKVDNNSGDIYVALGSNNRLIIERSTYRKDTGTVYNNMFVSHILVRF